MVRTLRRRREVAVTTRLLWEDRSSSNSFERNSLSGDWIARAGLGRPGDRLITGKPSS